MPRTIFDDIVEGKLKSWTIWEDDEFMAFLTPYPNTPGFTVVIPKQNPGDYIFSLNDELYVNFLLATKKVAHLLEKAFDTPRVALVFEGTGVAHVHAKLIPLHGELAGQTDVWSTEKIFNEEYRGWLTTEEGPQMSDERLDEIQEKIRSVAS
ncbi:MAG TPA: HIT family protein [Patescibacteria group bacterium]|jgi:diadenosine tetraphosphate (Ap4A) HIT family hydrolase|nr:HIT family protein [Patescibacteria group bacterium]